MSSRSLALVLAALAAASVLSTGRAPGGYPVATAWSPTGPSVPLEAAIVITWSVQMDAGSVEAAFSLSDGTANWTAGSFQWVHSPATPWKSTATPLAPFTPLTNFTARVAPGARDAIYRYPLDQDGNGVPGEPSDALVWTFRTEDGRSPEVRATIPTNGASGVAVATNLTVAFSEPMGGPSVVTAFAVSPSVPGAFNWDENRTTVTLDPALYLAYDTTYRVTVGGTDANGNPLDGNRDGTPGDPYTFAFTTELDTGPPRVLAVVPPRGAVNASAAANLQLRFSESMNRTSLAAAFSYSNGSGVWGASNGTLTWAGVVFADDLVSFNPFANLAFATRYTVTLNGSIATDLAGYTLDGNGDGVPQGTPTDDYAWTFTTEPWDRTRATVLSVSPAKATTNVFETTTVTVSFSEAMNQTTVRDAFSLSDAVRTWTAADGTFSWAQGSDAVTYAPTTTLSFNQAYAVRISTTAEDVSGNPLDGDGAGNGFVSSFWTRPQPDLTPPHVVSTDPPDGRTGVLRQSWITVTFDDAMDRPKTEAAIALENVTGYQVHALAIDGFTWTAAGHAVSFRAYGPLDWETRHRVTVSQGARNGAGLALEVPFTFFFTTAEWSGHVIGRVVSAEGPVADASVHLGNLTTQTTAEGAFSFPSVPSGAYTLVISKEGYVTKEVAVTLSLSQAGADLSTIDLGTIELARIQGAPVAAVIEGFLAILAGLIALTLFLRWRRGPPLDIEEPEADAPEEADVER